jgi:flagellar basal-body rod protein FlgF
MEKGMEATYTDHRPGNHAKSLSYVQGGAFIRDLSQGALNNTNNPLNMAITGQGYFVVQVGDSKQYTRDGRFRLDNQGALVTHDGHSVMAAGGSLNLGNYTNFMVGEDGAITAWDSTGAAAQLGKISIVTFENQQEALIHAGMGRFTTEQEELAPTNSTIMQGYLELSNTNPMTESIHLMTIMRNYEQHQRMTESTDELMMQTINLRIN